MIGFHNDTIETISDSIKFCKKINPDMAKFNIVIPIPGTILYNYCDENDLLIHKNWDLYTTRNQNIKINSIQLYKIEKIQKMTETLFLNKEFF
jgi:radical SAM superfamily enzyme YgiQ (UPF0313 family)